MDCPKNICSPSFDMIYMTPTPITLDCCNTAAVHPPAPYAEVEKENKMSIKNNTLTMTTDPRTEAERQREHLLERLSNSAYYLKIRDLEKQFNIGPMSPPKTPKEFRERMAAGLFVLEGEEKNQFPRYQGWYESLEWRDPQKPADPEGFKAAEKILQKMRNDAADDIIISEPAEGLKRLREFEAATVQ